MSTVAIVTGGRRGIGRAICEKLAGRGMSVLVVDLERDQDAEATLAVLKATGVKADFMAADVADEGTHAAMIERARVLGPLSTLVNNAGVSSMVRGDMLDLPVESLDRCIRINLRAPFLLSQTFAKALIGAGASAGHFCSIVNITSVNAEMIGLNRADYCITKAALSAASRLFASRLAGDGIQVYEIRPGIILTEMVQPSRAKYDKAIEDGAVPMNRWGDPADVGEAVATVASGALRYTTGDAIYVDGGLHHYRF